MNADREKDQNKNKDKNKGKKKNVARTVENLVKDIVESLGFGLWNVEYYKDAIEWILEITIERMDGSPVSIDDCEKVHRAVDPVIDEADPIDNSYSLQISSPGLNRELKKDFHFERYINRKVTVKLFAKHELIREKSFRGILLESNGDILKFEADLNDDGAEQIKQKHQKSQKKQENQKEQTEQPAQSCNIALQKKEIAHIYAYDDIDIYIKS